MHYVTEQLDKDGDGWPEGLGNVERPGMGDEKLDNAVYTHPRPATTSPTWRSRRATRPPCRGRARRPTTCASRFDPTWWYVPGQQFADSLKDPGNVQDFQKHWIGVTPMEAELTIDGQRVARAWRRSTTGTPRWPGARTRASRASGRTTAACSTPAAAAARRAPGERTIFWLNTAIQAVGEGNYGRLGADQQKRYTDAEVEPMFGEPYSGGDEVHHTPGTPDEQPGASPEILPSPDFDAAGVRDANVERCTRCRSMVMQAWNQYGTMWPVVHQQLGVRPDLGRGALEVVPQLPSVVPDRRLEHPARRRAR